MFKEYWITTLLNYQARIDRHQFRFIIKRDAVRIKITHHGRMTTAHFLEVSGREIASIDIYT